MNEGTADDIRRGIRRRTKGKNGKTVLKKRNRKGTKMEGFLRI